MPNISSLIKKTNYNTKISRLDGKINKVDSDAKNAIENNFLNFFSKYVV